MVNKIQALLAGHIGLEKTHFRLVLRWDKRRRFHLTSEKKRGQKTGSAKNGVRKTGVRKTQKNAQKNGVKNGKNGVREH